jgi:hypothetical protein
MSEAEKSITSNIGKNLHISLLLLYGRFIGNTLAWTHFHGFLISNGLWTALFSTYSIFTGFIAAFMALCFCYSVWQVVFLVNFFVVFLDWTIYYTLLVQTGVAYWLIVLFGYLVFMAASFVYVAFPKFVAVGYGNISHMKVFELTIYTLWIAFLAITILETFLMSVDRQVFLIPAIVAVVFFCVSVALAQSKISADYPSSRNYSHPLFLICVVSAFLIFNLHIVLSMLYWHFINDRIEYFKIVWWLTLEALLNIVIVPLLLDLLKCTSMTVDLTQKPKEK